MVGLRRRRAAGAHLAGWRRRPCRGVRVRLAGLLEANDHVLLVVAGRHRVADLELGEALHLRRRNLDRVGAVWQLECDAAGRTLRWLRPSPSPPWSRRSSSSSAQSRCARPALSGSTLRGLRQSASCNLSCECVTVQRSLRLERRDRRMRPASGRPGRLGNASLARDTREADTRRDACAPPTHGPAFRVGRHGLALEEDTPSRRDRGPTHAPGARSADWSIPDTWVTVHSQGHG